MATEQTPESVAEAMMVALERGASKIEIILAARRWIMAQTDVDLRLATSALDRLVDGPVR